MTEVELDPRRWKDQAGDEPSSEGELGKLVRNIGQAPQLSEAHLAHIAASLHPPSHRPTVLRYWPAALVVLLGSSFATAAHLGWTTRWLRSGVTKPAVASAPQPQYRRTASHPSGPSLATSRSTVQEDRRAELPASPNVSSHSNANANTSAHPARTTRAPRIPETRETGSAGLNRGRKLALVVETNPVAPKAEPNPPELMGRPVQEAQTAAPVIPARPETEVEKTPVTIALASGKALDGTHWLAEAIKTLRQNRGPVSALDILDKHAQELSRAGLTHESILVRIEALLALHRSSEALRLLDATSLADVTAARGLLLTRAELRAAAGRCADGLGDFDWLLLRARQPDERALYGRAVCRQRTGDGVGARKDFEQYREFFPRGAHFIEVGKQLGGP